MTEQYSDVAVLLPCYNEEVTIAKVVTDFKKVLPNAKIYVFDNNSADKTAERASGAGATVVPSMKQGKGNVVRHMFEVVESKYYIMADGDDTYPASSATALLDLLKKKGADVVVGTRMSNFDKSAFRAFHEFGNHLVSFLIRRLFGVRVTDVLSGYRVFSRDFVKTVPLLSEGFEVETEITLQAAAKGYMICESPIDYGSRPEGSFSKLHTYSDGYLILKAILMIFKDFKPLIFFAVIAGIFTVLSLWSGWGPIQDFIQTGYVNKVPRAILAAALGILACLSFSVGLILDTGNKYHNENFALWRRMLKK